MKTRRAWTFAWFAILALVGVALAEGRELSGVVSRIHDGDTITVRNVGKVRLLGIDTPETGDTEYRDTYYIRRGIDRRALRQIARQALHFNIKNALNQRVTLELGDEAKDHYGRWLAYVWLPDGRMLNRMLLEEGLATTFTKFSFARRDEFLDAERDARHQRRGMWAKERQRSFGKPMTR